MGLFGLFVIGTNPSKTCIYAITRFPPLFLNRRVGTGLTLTTLSYLASFGRTKEGHLQSWLRVEGRLGLDQPLSHVKALKSFYVKGWLICIKS